MAVLLESDKYPLSFENNPDVLPREFMIITTYRNMYFGTLFPSIVVVFLIAVHNGLLSHGVISVLAATNNAHAVQDKSSLYITTFTSDVTPPLGHPICGGYCIPVTAVEDALEAKGIIIEQDGRRYVLCAVDWCGLSNTAFDAFQKKIAVAAATRPENVAVQCLHLHTAPLADGYANKMLAKVKSPIAMHDEKYLDETTDRLAIAVKESLGRFKKFDRIGFGQAKVERVASSRRIMADGTLFVRASSTKDKKLQNLPEGTIDPMLKTITFAFGEQPLVRLHYYATHPQSFYGDGRISSDVPGFARKQREQKEGVFQVYFTGCGGNVAMGKYNDGSSKARDELVAGLLSGMDEASISTRFVPAEKVNWRTAELLLPLRQTERFNVEKQNRVLADPQESKSSRIEAAEYLAFARRIEKPIIVSAMQIGDVFILNLPGEAFIEYQLYAQGIMPGEFVAVAGYGEYDPVYLCTEKALQEGGYEPTEAMSGPPCESFTKKAIRQVLNAE